MRKRVVCAAKALNKDQPSKQGWSLSMGSITAAQYPSTSAGGATTWYSINGVDGISDKLIPIPGQLGFYETEHISHMRIYFTGSFWQIWGVDGTYYELGATSDSTQKTSAGTYEWDLDAIQAPFNSTSLIKTIFVSYLQDSPDGGTTIRDAGIKQVQYGYTTSPNATSLSQVMGTLDFHYHAPTASATSDGQGQPWAVAYGTNYNCTSTPSQSTTLRCDDPITYNSIASPEVMPTLSLDSVTVYRGSDVSGQGNIAYNYALGYQDTPFTTSYTDPYTLVQESAAGEHLLMQITPTVYVGGTAHTRKGVLLSYASGLTDSYRDPSQTAIDGSTAYSAQTSWSYLNWYMDKETGEGAVIVYKTGYANMHGTPDATNSQGTVIDDRFDPLFCSIYTTCTGVYAHPEDYSWSLQLVTQIQALGTDSSGNTMSAYTDYAYGLGVIASTNTPVSSCNPITGSGVPSQEADCVGDSWVPSVSSGTPQNDGDWQDYYHSEFRGFGTVQILSPSNDVTADWYVTTAGWWSPESWSSNYNGGQLTKEDVYQGDSWATNTLLSETHYDYAGLSGDGIHPNPFQNLDPCDTSTSVSYTPCVMGALDVRTTWFEGNYNWTNAPWQLATYTYDDINPSTGYVSTGYHNMTQEVITSSNAQTITKKWTYQPTNTTVNGVIYYNVNKVIHSEIDDAKGHWWQCQDTTYDEGAPSGVPTPAEGLATTVTDYSSCGNSSTALKSYTGYDQYGNAVATVDPLAAANPSLYGSNGCVLSTAPVDVSASWTLGHYTSCTTYDTSYTAALPVIQTNVLGQTTSSTYDYTSGEIPSSTTDLNNQTTSYGESYDGSGNETITTSAPGETGSYTTKQNENSSCTSTSVLPCYEIDTNSLLYSSAISRTFYDALGHAVETRTPGPTPGDDSVVITVYNEQNNSAWKSNTFQVADGSGWIDPTGAKDINGNAPAGTTTFYDALGRVIATQDPNYGSAQEPGISCSTLLTGTYTTCTNYSWGQALSDSNQYAITTDVDANGHVVKHFTDTQANEVYTQEYAGVYGGTLSTSVQISTQYNALNKPILVGVDDKAPQSGQSTTSVQTTMTYDDMGRLLTMSDPDQGTFSYTYDPDGQILSVTQTSGSSSRTLGFNYDLLGREGCEQTAAPTINATGACSAGSPLLQNTYDTNILGTQGTTDFPVGHLTQSVATTYYPDGTSATVTQQAQFDQRGHTTTSQMQLGVPSSWNITTALPTFQVTQAYNDADQSTTTTATAGSASYTFSQVYDSTNGVVQGLSNNSTATANLAQLSYNEYAQLGSLTLLNGATSSPVSLASETFNYDANLRPISLSASWLPGSNNSGQILSQGRTYDNADNITSVNTTFAAVPGQTGSGGSEMQNFCYDEQNRLVWAGNGGTQPGAGNGTCGSGTLASGLSGAGYASSYSYTNLGQIWQGPLNGTGSSQQYLSCNSAPHELTGIYPIGTTCATMGSATAVYSARYDAWGNETSRFFSGTPATLSYDALNRLVTWDAGPNNREWYVYDASGNRVLRRTTNGSGTTLTAYAFGQQTLNYSGTGTFGGQTDYYELAGHLLGSTDGSTTSYDLTDAQGSVLTSFSASAIQGEQTYGPYGNPRYWAGSMSTDKGYTGQVHDFLTGLDYYVARYYDPVAGVFLSPDSQQGNAQAMDPYSYVGDSPETRIDPSGQKFTCQCGHKPPPPPPPHAPKQKPKPQTPQRKSTPAPKPTQSPTPAPTTTPTQQQKITSGQQAALANAADASSFFAMLGNWANGIAGVMAAVGSIAAAATVFVPTLLEFSTTVLTLAGVIWELGQKADELSRSFNDMTRAGDSWFTHGDIENQMWKVGMIAAGATLGTSGALGIAGWQLVQRIAATTGKQLITKVTIEGTAVDLAGSIFLGAWAEADLVQENNMVRT